MLVGMSLLGTCSGTIAMECSDAIDLYMPRLEVLEFLAPAAGLPQHAVLACERTAACGGWQA